MNEELTEERNHLAQSRAELARMRERTLALDIQGGDAVSAERLAETLWRRAKSLEDDPTTALFFGRVDLDGTGGSGEGADERWYIGRRHVTDDAGDPLVIDWRAPVSTTFYRASHADPMGVRLRRRFGYDRGQITAMEDEHLLDSGEPEARSQILATEIERPRVGPMRDIVATIQPEQDALVRVDATTTVCIQGAPGTGKTAVGLHRAAWLLYAYRQRLGRTGVLVIGPNDAFLEHIGAVLPTLGEVEVRHTSIEALTQTDKIRVRASEPADVAQLKGDARMAEVLHRAVWSHLVPPAEAMVVPRGVRRWRVPAYDVAPLVDGLAARDVRYESARLLLPQRLAHAVLVKMEALGEYPDDRVQDAIAKSAPVKAYAGGLWPKVDARALLHRLLSDPEALAAASEGVLTEDEQRLLLWEKPSRTSGSAKWTVADTVLLDELGDLLERTPSLGHVVLDEAQDLSPMQLRAVGRRCTAGAATVLGDIAQGTTPWSTASWAESLRHLGKPEGVVEELRRGFRVSASVIEFAARLLPQAAPGLAAPESVRDNPGRLDLVEVGGAEVVGRVVGEVQRLAALEGSIGVIVPDARVPEVSRALTGAGVEHGTLGLDHGDVDHQVDVVPATVAKGLEFDHVLVLEPAEIAAAEPDERTGLRRLYVVLTRAVSDLTVIHAEPLPEALAT
ncbi:HelD family protein [Knoellia subterranea]|uniref:ATPase AAA n=1 Tax=Knoellia subterranea KCTC 19937 TaxID=1385521 RepID=A0A0A0JKN8_9MICO|nr:AAA family ATPase [Knoellia subterranea]KGN37985.1 ATPase AAA [Knoellia subterranea KCTC 19937]